MRPARPISVSSVVPGLGCSSVLTVVRWASPAEREENINLSAIFVVLGFVLILVGVAADNRYDLV